MIDRIFKLYMAYFNKIIYGGKKNLELLAVINYTLDVGKERREYAKKAKRASGY